MSYASIIKNQLIHGEDEDFSLLKAEFLGLIRTSAAIFFDNKHNIGFTIQTENASVARRVVFLLKKLANKDIKTEITVTKTIRLRKNNLYQIRVLPSKELDLALLQINFISAINLLDPSLDKEILKSNEEIFAYLKGAFLGGGSISNPEKSYHLEIKTINYNFALFLKSLMIYLYLPANVTDRKDMYIVYLKDSEGIIEFLSYIGLGSEYIEAFESIRNLKEIRNQVNRIVNCETANLQKTVNASMKQIEAIKKIKHTRFWLKLDNETKITANLRLKRPNDSLIEMGKTLKCSKSVIYNRLQKIIKLSRKYEEQI